MGEDRESIRVLGECAKLQAGKSEDYQNAKSTVTQAMYYPRGIETINDIIWAKMLRIRSLVEKHVQDPNSAAPNFEGIEDSYKDMINYASFAVAWCRGKVPGQGHVDITNRPVPVIIKSTAGGRADGGNVDFAASGGAAGR